MSQLKTGRIDSAYCEGLVQSAVQGDGEARRRLIEYLWPHWMDLLRTSRSMGAYAKSEDHQRNVAIRLMAKLSEQGRGLEMFDQWQQEHPQRAFDDWMRIVTTNAARDYLREQLGPRVLASREPSRKRLLNEFTLAPIRDEIGMRPAMTQEQTARELCEFAATRLSPQQAAALALWLTGSTFEELESELGLSAGLGRRTVRSAVAMLRRHFVATHSEIDDPPA